jgi:hypothetical protein
MQKKSILSVETIKAILSLREKTSALKVELKTLEGILENRESDLLNQHERGLKTPIGFEIVKKEVERRYPKWKEHFINIAGSSAADQVLADTTPTVSTYLVIAEISAVKEAA